MKNFVLFLLIVVSCNSYKVRNTTEVGKLKTNEGRYKNQPIKKLIRDLKVPIQSVYANIGSEEELDYIGVNFYPIQQYRIVSGPNNRETLAHLFLFLKPRNHEKDYLFLPEKLDKNDSINNRRRISLRSGKLNTNRKLLKPYKDFIIVGIYARSEQPKK